MKCRDNESWNQSIYWGQPSLRIFLIRLLVDLSPRTLNAEENAGKLNPEREREDVLTEGRG